ncbi:MAG: sugar ABC transporter ATP-binding protein, partial [Gemmatimonadales bacterium]
MPAVRFAGLTKRFPGVTALDGVSFTVAAGSCHAVCGENGAGKSTLGKILAGIQEPDGGSIELGGTPVRFGSPRDALANGVAMVHQELAFCDNMTVAENLCLGRMPSRRGWLMRDAMRDRARVMLSAIGAEIDVTRQVESLSIGEQQLVQIAAAVGSGATVIVFDEPTSSLGENDAERLFRLIGDLKARGVAVIYISHRMAEIFRLCDSVTVLRDGRHVSTDAIGAIGAIDEATVVQRMIGRKLEQYFPSHAGAMLGDEVLRVGHLSSPGKFRDISFTLRAGEVLGLAGLVGAGRSEVAQALFGLDPEARGDVWLHGARVRIGSAREALSRGLALVPEDRKRQGLVLSMLARENTTLPVLEGLSHFSLIRRGAERELARTQTERLKLRNGVLENETTSLSGGNQQKLVLAKWLAARSEILMLDEPTRGVDVGAKAELHAWIDAMASEGAAVLLISSELPELLNLSRRILVLRAGRIVGEL